MWNTIHAAPRQTTLRTNACWPVGELLDLGQGMRFRILAFVSYDAGADFRYAYRVEEVGRV